MISFTKWYNQRKLVFLKSSMHFGMPPSLSCLLYSQLIPFVYLEDAPFLCLRSSKNSLYSLPCSPLSDTLVSPSCNLACSNLASLCSPLSDALVSLAYTPSTYAPFTSVFVFPSLRTLALFSPVFAPRSPLCFLSPIGLLCLLFEEILVHNRSLLCCSLCCWSNAVCCL